MTKQINEVLQAAIKYYKAGLTIVPIGLDGSKAPTVSWRGLITTRPTEAEVRQFFAKADVGIAILGGATSGGLEILDFDIESAFDEFAELLNEVWPDLLPRLPVIKTPSGYHVYFRSAKADGNQKLARASEKNAAKNDNTKIETRGEGGYVIAPPSPPAVHPSGKPYAFHSGPRISKVPTLTDDERQVIFDCARSLNEVAEKEQKASPRAKAAAGRPGDDFDERADWAMILEPHGWKRIRQRGSSTHWRRPGKTDNSVSATTGYCGDKLYVFSSNAEPFDSPRAYSKFSAYGLLNHGGDYAAATRDVLALGYGERRPRASQPPPHSDADAPSFIDDRALDLQPDESPPEQRTHLEVVRDSNPITATELDRQLEDDKGAASTPENLTRLGVVFDRDQAEWVRIENILRRHKVIRPVMKAMHKRRASDREPRNVSPAMQKAVKLGRAMNSGREIMISSDIETMNDEALAAMASAKTDVYQKDGRLVQVVTDLSGIESISGRSAPMIQEVQPDRLRELLASAACWKKIGVDREGNEVERIVPPPRESATALLQRGSWGNLRRIVGVTEVPVIRPDGSVLTKAGYDPGIGMIYRPLADIEVIDKPTRKDIESARDALLDVVIDFPFDSDTHRAAYLAAVLSPFARYAYRGPTPLFLVDANTRASGKTLVATTISKIATGRDLPIGVGTDDPSEQRKQITSLALSGARIAFLDNVNELGGEVMNAVLTAVRWRDRILGGNSIAEVDLSAIWVATGNNTTLDGDMCRRVLPIRLRAQDERPENRTNFKHPELMTWLESEWPRLAGAALTLLRGYILAGKPAVDGVTTWGSYEGWSRVVPRCVAWAGAGNPTLLRISLVDSGDTERDAIIAFMRALHGCYGVSGSTARNMLRDVHSSNAGSNERELREAVLELCPSRSNDLPSTRVLGNKLSKIRERVVADMRLRGEKNRVGVLTWYADKLDQPQLPLRERTPGDDDDRPF